MATFNNKYYTFTEYTEKYSVILRSENVDLITTTLGLVASDTRPDDAENLTLKEAVIDKAVMIPLKLDMTYLGKSRQAYVPCPVSKVEEALHPSTGLKGKKYGNWTIAKAYAELDKAYRP